MNDKQDARNHAEYDDRQTSCGIGCNHGRVGGAAIVGPDRPKVCENLEPYDQRRKDEQLKAEEK